MTTWRERFDGMYTETKRVVIKDGEPVVKQVVCCCTKPAAKAMECADARGLRTRCRCYCHSTKVKP